MSLKVPKNPLEILTPLLTSHPTPQALQHLRDLCDELLANDETFSVTFSKIPCPEGKNHLFTLKPHYWEIEPGKWEHRDGQRNPYCDLLGGQKQLQAMSRAVHTLSLGVGYLGAKDNEWQDRCLTRIEHVLNVFFVDEDTRMIPEVWYAQCQPGENPARGNYGFVIAVRNILLVSQSLPLVQDKLSDALVTQIKDWFKAQTEWMETSEQGKAVRAMNNHHTTWYHAVLASHLTCIDKKRGVSHANQFFDQKMKDHTDPFTFNQYSLGRARPRHSTLFALEPIFIMAALTYSSELEKPSKKIVNYLTDLVNWAKTVEPGDIERPLEEQGRFEAKLGWFERMLKRWSGEEVATVDPQGENLWEEGWKKRMKVTWGFL
ncbi:DNA phosphorothioation-dependent restriction protein DptG [Cryptococcus depauperatus]